MVRKPASRRAKAGREVAVSDGVVTRLAERALENPAMSGGLLVMALTAGAIVSNAMFLQGGRHPDPLFATRPAAVPRPPVPQPILAPPAAVPLPRSRAEAAAESPRPLPPTAVGEGADPSSDRALISDTQRELARLGLYVGAIDGIFGSRTRAAISAYEAAAGLPVTGEVSAALLQALRTPEKAATVSSQSAASAAAPAEPAAADSVEPAAVSDGDADLAAVEKQRAVAEEQARYFRVQAALNLIGYGPIAVDGEAGQQTADAVRRFELDNGLPITGTVNDRLIERLVAIGAMQSM